MQTFPQDICPGLLKHVKVVADKEGWRMALGKRALGERTAKCKVGSCIGREKGVSRKTQNSNEACGLVNKVVSRSMFWSE
jgi:hypothetical protein